MKYLLLFVLCMLCTSSQSQCNGPEAPIPTAPISVSGVLVDASSNNPVGGVSVRLLSYHNGVYNAASAFTGADGKFHLSGEAPLDSQYSLVASDTRATQLPGTDYDTIPYHKLKLPLELGSNGYAKLVFLPTARLKTVLEPVIPLADDDVFEIIARSGEKVLHQRYRAGQVPRKHLGWPPVVGDEIAVITWRVSNPQGVREGTVSILTPRDRLTEITIKY